MIPNLDKLSPEEICAEIKRRQELLPTFVGWLYPSIVKDEIIELRNRYFTLTGKSDHP